MADDTDTATVTEGADAASGGPAIGTIARAAVAVSGILVGLVWTARVAVDGTVASGVLLQLLPPLALVYLGIRYLQSVLGSERREPR